MDHETTILDFLIRDLLQAGELASYLERVRKSKDKTDVLTEEKLIELLKKGEHEEIVRILATESAGLSNSPEKGTPRISSIATNYQRL
jgi:hypothetical protein